jgi:hypothetical protein
MTTPSSPRFATLTADGSVEDHEIEAELAAVLKPLPYAPERYFIIGQTTTMVPLDRLVASRARPNGIRNANVLMLQAHQGTIPRRAPVTIKALPGNRWLVVDGNSTLINALASDWPDLPCDVQPTAEKSETIRAG